MIGAQPPPGRLVLFDIDGTLLLSGGAGQRAMARAARDLFGERFIWEGIQTAGGLDPLIFAEAAAQSRIADPVAAHTAFRARYLVLLEEELRGPASGLRVLPGVHEVLAALRPHRHLTLGLLTGNYGPAAELKLLAAKIAASWFTVTAFGDEAEDRSALARVALERYAKLSGAEVAPQRILVVGDTPRDVACALANGCVAFGVATGSYSVADLLAAGAHGAAEDLSDPRPLLAFLELGG